MGCTTTNPREIANYFRNVQSGFDFEGREEILCQPRFGALIERLKKR